MESGDGIRESLSGIWTPLTTQAKDGTHSRKNPGNRGEGVGPSSALNSVIRNLKWVSGLLCPEQNKSTRKKIFFPEIHPPLSVRLNTQSL